MVMNVSDTGSVTFEEQERASTRLLVVEPHEATRELLLAYAKRLSLGHVSEAADYAGALRKLKERSYTHILFSTESSSSDAQAFLQEALKEEPEPVLIALAEEAYAEDVLGYLQGGAHSFFVVPGTQKGLEEVLVNASRSNFKPGVILQRTDRNKALVSMLFTYVEQISKVQRQALSHPEQPHDELPSLIAAFRETAHMARTFCEGGEAGLLETVIEMAILQAKEPATALGRLRKKLHQQRSETKEG